MVEINYKLGPKYLLTIIDHFSRFAWAYALNDKKAESIITSLESFFK